ncbi:hypothetical protein BDZ88DRAFT_403610 [Geranomyces variabilis]|nr:hypothetical protein BDZ88DRAFT_403610 [Geranomyces variabilis]KAJ3141616.1 Polycomb group RING finger protein 1 [Geranomyces variabilis]
MPSAPTSLQALPSPRQRSAMPHIRVPTALATPFVTCTLCDGYLVGATTIDPCLHTFCKSCIYKYWKKGHPRGCPPCPTCGTVLGVNPAVHLRPDRGMQAVAYVLAPGLMEAEKEALTGGGLGRPATDPVAAAAEGAAHAAKASDTHNHNIAT